MSCSVRRLELVPAVDISQAAASCDMALHLLPGNTTSCRMLYCSTAGTFDNMATPTPDTRSVEFNCGRHTMHGAGLHNQLLGAELKRAQQQNGARPGTPQNAAAAGGIVAANGLVSLTL